MHSRSNCDQERASFDWRFPPGELEDLLGCEVITSAFSPDNPDVPAEGLRLSEFAIERLYKSASDRVLTSPALIQVFQRIPDPRDPSGNLRYWVPREGDLDRCWQGFRNWYWRILTPALADGPWSPRLRQIRAALSFNQTFGRMRRMIDHEAQVCRLKVLAKRKGRLGHDELSAGDIYAAVQGYPGTLILRRGQLTFDLLPLKALDALRLPRAPRDALDLVTTVTPIEPRPRSAASTSSRGSKDSDFVDTLKYPEDPEPGADLERRDLLDRLALMRRDDPALVAAFVYLHDHDHRSRQRVAAEFGVTVKQLRSAEKRAASPAMKAVLRRLGAA